MSHSVPQQQSALDAARGDVASAPLADRPLPDFPPHDVHSPIEREIERSERASAALAATRALARASFTDSQLAEDDADIDTSGWIRTEYAALDHSVRTPQEDVPHGGTPRNLVGGSFNPGIASQHARAYLGASLAHAPIKTRTGAQARFMHEARQTPRVERIPAGTTRSDLSLSAGTAHYDKPAVVPMLATPPAGPAAGRPIPASLPKLAPSRVHKPPSEPLKFAIAVGLGAVVVLMGGGVAWKAGLLSHPSPSNAALITPQVAAQAEAARVLSSVQQEIPIVPAAGTPGTRSNAEVDAALAAAARAAAVPVASVHAAGPARVVRPLDPSPLVAAVAHGAAAPALTVATTTPAAPKVPPAAHGKDSVAAAIANAQARADSFLASGSGVNAAAASPEAKPAQQ